MFGTKPRTNVEEAYHTEMKRQEYDVVRITNPRQITVKSILYDLPHKDFYIQYDVNQYQKVPYGVTMDLVRPRAILFIKHKKDEIINFITQKMHDDFIVDRAKKGLPAYVDKATENKETYETQAFPRTDDLSLINEIYSQLWLGITLVAASDKLPQNLDSRSGEVDLTTNDQKALDRLSSKMVNTKGENPPVTDSTPYVPQSNFSAMNDKLDVSEVTKNEQPT